MKYLLTSILFIFFFLGFVPQSKAQTNEDAISKYFSKYVDDERFTVVYISGKMLQMINKMELQLDDQEAQAILSVVKNLKGLRILTTDAKGTFYEDALKVFNRNEYETLMTVREGKKENVQFLARQKGDVVNELLLLAGGPNTEFVLMSFIGNIDLNEVGKLSKAFKEKEKSKN